MTADPQVRYRIERDFHGSRAMRQDLAAWIPGSGNAGPRGGEERALARVYSACNGFGRAGT